MHVDYIVYWLCREIIIRIHARSSCLLVGCARVSRLDYSPPPRHVIIISSGSLVARCICATSAWPSESIACARVLNLPCLMVAGNRSLELFCRLSTRCLKTRFYATGVGSSLRCLVRSPHRMLSPRNEGDGSREVVWWRELVSG